MNDLTVELSNKIKDMTVLISGVEKEFKINPSIKKHYIVLEKPTLDDQRDDLMRIKDFLKESFNLENIDIDLNVLRKIPKALREDNYDITVTMFDNKIIRYNKRQLWSSNRYRYYYNRCIFDESL